MFEKVCFNCFTAKQNDEACPVCGFDNRTGIGSNQSHGVSLAPGTIIGGRFIVGKALGQGGFGITYLSLDLKTGKIVAIKEFFPSHLVSRQETGLRTSVQPNSTKDEDIFRYGLKKFKEEAELLATFRNQEHIVSVHRFFYGNNTGYFVMDFIDGISLKDYVRRMNGRLLYPDVVGIIDPILKAIAFIHSKGLIHRDVSPDNVFIQKDGTVKLLDFGAARFFTQSKGKAMTTILKPGFAPPEQYTSTGKQGPWTDIYAVAGTMYYALTGKTPLDSLSRKLDDQLIRPTTINPSINQAQEAVLLKGLAIDPSARYGSAIEFRQALIRSIQPILSRRTIANRRQLPAAQPAQVRAGQQSSAAPVLAVVPEPAAIPAAAPIAEVNPLPGAAESCAASAQKAAPEPIVEDNAVFDDFFDEEDDILCAEDAEARDENRAASCPEIWNQPKEAQKRLSIVDYVLYGLLVFIVIVVIIILLS